MEGGIEEPFAPALGALAVAGIRCDVGDQAGIEHARASVRGINASVEMQRGSSRSKPTVLATLFKALRPAGRQRMSGSWTGATGSGDSPSP